MSITFESTGSGTSWLMVPTYQKFDFTVESGNFENVSWRRYGPFYANQTFNFTDGTSFEISYSDRFGAFIVEPTGAFFSTLVGFDPRTRGSVTVSLPPGVSILRTYLNKAELEPDSRSAEGAPSITYDLPKENVALYRVMVIFQVPGELQTVERTSGLLTVTAPARYADVAENITRLYDRYLHYLLDLTGVGEVPINLTLYMPSSPDEIFTLGYTSVSSPYELYDNVITPGSVSLNLILVRMVGSQLQNTLIHELLHQYMLRAGLSTELRWAHEGMAQYLSILIVRQETGNSSYGQEDIQAAGKMAQMLNYDLGFLQDWRGGGIPEDSNKYYLSSLYIFSQIGEGGGGFDLYKRFFHLIREDGVLVNTTGQLVSYLSKAAGSDLSVDFRRLGFRFSTVQSTPPAGVVVPMGGGRYPPLMVELNPFSALAWEMDRMSVRAALAGDMSRVGALRSEARAFRVLGPLMGASIIAGAVTLISAASWAAGIRRRSYRPPRASPGPPTYP